MSRGKPALQVRDGIAAPAPDRFAVDGECPSACDHRRVGRNAIVANEQAFRRGDVVVQQVRRGLRAQRPVVQHYEPVLAFDMERFRGVGQRCRDEANRHVTGRRRSARRARRTWHQRLQGRRVVPRAHGRRALGPPGRSRESRARASSSIPPAWAFRQIIACATWPRASGARDTSVATRRPKARPA